MTRQPKSDGQQAASEQSKTKTATEFFREKFADDDSAEEETQPVWIDPKGDGNDELSKHRFVAGKTGVGKSVHLASLSDKVGDEQETGQ